MEIELEGLKLKTGDIVDIAGIKFKVTGEKYNFDPFEPDPDDMSSKIITKQKK